MILSATKIINKVEVIKMAGNLVVRKTCCSISKAWQQSYWRYAHVDQDEVCSRYRTRPRRRHSGAMARGSYGSVMPGSLDGVNPADHPAIFENPGVAASYGFVKTPHGWPVARSHVRRSNG
jgi:hypothetical protein